MRSHINPFRFFATVLAGWANQRQQGCMSPKLNLAKAISWRRKLVGGGGVPIQESSRELHPQNPIIALDFNPG